MNRVRPDRTNAPVRERLLDVREAAALLAIRPATLYQWAYLRRLPVVKLLGPRGPLRFRESDIMALIHRSLRPALGETVRLTGLNENVTGKHGAAQGGQEGEGPEPDGCGKGCWPPSPGCRAGGTR